MHFPSLSTILGSIFVAYIGYSIYSLSQIFASLECISKPCFQSYINKQPKLQLNLFTTTAANPVSETVKKIGTIENFDYNKEFTIDYKIDVPLKTRRNGTLFLHVVLSLKGESFEWKNLPTVGPTIIQRFKLTEYMIPKATTYNLLENKVDINNENKFKNSIKPVTHFKPKVYMVLLTEKMSFSRENIPPELGRFIKVNQKHEVLPIIYSDYLRYLAKDLIQITKDDTEIDLQFNYHPISLGKFRLLLQIEHSVELLEVLGFSKKDIDDVKGIFSGTNIYLLCITLVIASVHLLFDFLSFKNDISFWKQRNNYVGLSIRSIFWRTFSQIIIFLHLWDENASLLILFPSGIAAIIELWKCKKICKLSLSFKNGFSNIIKLNKSDATLAEKKTNEIDKEAMKYLSYLLYPLCICGAIYSLLYQPHRGWYSWTLNSVINGVYAFGFLFMLPQLFVNYKLKSVATLPWRALMYKAFNTFIDDIFAFIITVPTSHRVACFRDDVVFVIYIIQRFMYPVDNTRIDAGTSMGEALVEKSEKKDN